MMWILKNRNGDVQESVRLSFFLPALWPSSRQTRLRQSFLPVCRNIYKNLLNKRLRITNALIEAFE